MKSCPSCGKKVKDEAKFCTGCGYKFESSAGSAPTASANTCPSCGNALKAGAKFCNKCGSKVESASSATTTATEPIANSASNGEAPAQAGKDFSLLGQFIHWNILPGQIAVKIDANDIAAYGKVRGVNIQDGVKALFFFQGKLIAELESGTYDFKSLGAGEFTKERVVTEEPVKKETPEPKLEKIEAKKKSFGSFFSNITSFFRGGHRQRAQNAGLTVRIPASIPPVAIVLVRNVEFPMLFDFKGVSATDLKVDIGLHVLCKISDINAFYKNQLLDNRFVCLENVSKTLEPLFQNCVNSVISKISADSISNNESVKSDILASVKQSVSGIYPYIEITQIINLTSVQKELDGIRRLREELYVSELELAETTKRNEFLNRMNSETNQQALREARSQVDFEQAMIKIDEDHQLNEDERSRFALMLAAQQKLREAKSEDEVQAALQEFKKSGLLRDEEINNLQHEIKQRADVRDLADSQIIALATMQNKMELDKQQLDWEISIGNKRIENQIERQRMQDSYADERQRVQDEHSDERRRSQIQLDKEEQLNQLELLRQAQAIRNEREDLEHKRQMETDRLKMEADKQVLDADVEKNRIYQNMSAEQIMAANPNISKEAAAAMAEKFKAEAAAVANDKTSDILQQQNAQMMAFMSQQMAAVREMSMSMSGAQNAANEKLLQTKDDEINRVTNSVNNAVNTVAGAFKATPVQTVSPQAEKPVTSEQPVATKNVALGKICPQCGTENPSESLFCENCGEQM